MPAPAKNQNAAKPEEEKLTARLHIACSEDEKKRYLNEAKGTGLAKWVREKLNAQLGR